MNRATGGGLPARIFKSFMESSSHDLPVRRLPGADFLLAARSGDDMATARENSFGDNGDSYAANSQNDDGILEAFAALLERLF